MLFFFTAKKTAKIQYTFKRWSPNPRDSDIDAALAEHLNHAPGRAGGGGYKN